MKNMPNELSDNFTAVQSGAKARLACPGLSPAPDVGGGAFTKKPGSWPITVGYGGGDNSRALLIEMHRRGIVPDLILFADTGGELPNTYANNAAFSAWLVSVGMPPIIVVKDGRTTLEREVLDANTLPSKAFGFASCSDKYKLRPQNRYLAKWQPAIDAWAVGGKVVRLVGYDVNERHRIKDYDDKRFLVRYPLVDWGWGRERCTAEVIKGGFESSKSACFFCPSMKKREVLALSVNYPDHFARAVAMERNATAATTAKGLGRNWSWEALVNADADQLKLFEESHTDVPCGCYDGGTP